ncbi:putative invertase inhibitor [Aristolochia californica]|uniref:putative invertase inhibitor n=1 Tax=Aristolochia californica TaxID=171875 RepID=UPI0035DD272C
MANIDLVIKTCDSIEDKPFCIVTFAYDPRSLAADVPDLARIGAEYASSNATGIIDHLSQLGGDAVMAEIRNGCRVAYSDAVKGLGDTIRYLDSKDYDKAAAGVGGAVEKPSACEKLFHDKGQEYPPELAHWAEIMQSLCRVSNEIIVLLQ